MHHLFKVFKKKRWIKGKVHLAVGNQTPALFSKWGLETLIPLYKKSAKTKIMTLCPPSTNTT
jgi:hypothetical protein